MGSKQDEKKNKQNDQQTKLDHFFFFAGVSFQFAIKKEEKFELLGGRLVANCHSLNSFLLNDNTMCHDENGRGECGARKKGLQTCNNFIVLNLASAHPPSERCCFGWGTLKGAKKCHKRKFHFSLQLLFCCCRPNIINETKKKTWNCERNALFASRKRIQFCNFFCIGKSFFFVFHRTRRRNNKS